MKKKPTTSKTNKGTTIVFAKHPSHRVIDKKVTAALFKVLDTDVSKSEMARELGVTPNGGLNALLFRAVQKMYKEGKVTFSK